MSSEVPVFDMTCEALVELVTAYLDGALDRTTEQRFVEHLAGCDGCDRYLDQIRTTADATGDLPGPGLAPETTARLLAAFRDWTDR
jgi:anti-sigma factor RsiW